MSRILSCAVVAWGLAMAVFAPHPGSAATNISGQTNSATLPSGVLVQLSPTLQPPIIGSFSWTFSGSSSVITPDRKYMYVLINTYQIGPNTLTSGPNKILTYAINADGTLTPRSDPQAGEDTTGTSLYLANQGRTLLTLNSDGSSASANTAPFQIFQIGGDGSLSPIPNSVQLPAAQTVLSTGAMGSAAADGSGQFFYAALVDNDPNDSGYLTSSVAYAFKIGTSGTVSYVSVFNFTPPPQPDYIFNILTTGKFLYIFGNSNVYIAAVGSDRVAQPPAKPTSYNSDPNFSEFAFFGMQISPGTQDFYAVDSLDVGVSSLGICHYRVNNDGTIQFPPTDCQTVLSNIPSGESFGAFGLYIPPSGEFLYSLFEGSVADSCDVSMYAYTVDNGGALNPLNFSSASPANSLPIGNNFCTISAISGTPDGSNVYALGSTGTSSEGYNNTIVPFRVQTGLTSPGSATDRLDPLIAFIGALRLPPEIKRVLIAALVAAQQRLDGRRLDAACSRNLAAFIESAAAQNENTLDAAHAAELVAEATAITEFDGLWAHSTLADHAAQDLAELAE